MSEPTEAEWLEGNDPMTERERMEAAMTVDIRTAAQRESDKQYPETPFAPENEQLAEAFLLGAVWGATRVTPTREQIAIALAKQKARDWDSMLGVMHLAAIHSEYFNADAVLALMQELSSKEDA